MRGGRRRSSSVRGCRSELQFRRKIRLWVVGDAAGEPAGAGAAVEETGVDLVGREPSEVLRVAAGGAGGDLRVVVFKAEDDLVSCVGVDGAQKMYATKIEREAAGKRDAIAAIFNAMPAAKTPRTSKPQGS